jgi:DNA polymerase III delta prime subunit
MSDNFLWVEKYRPKTIKDCILPDGIGRTFSSIVESGVMPNLLLSGGPGVGKTTVAKALCEELNYDYLFVNGTEDNGIDGIRTTLRQYASSVSLDGKDKVIIIDEADYLSHMAQPALRGFIEEFSHNCRFIFTCNFKNKIIKPLHSRCSVVDFNIDNKEKSKLASKFYNRLCYILKEEGVTYESDVVRSLLVDYFPDWRRCINELQSYSSNGVIDVGILSDVTDIKDLCVSLKNKKFSEMRKWVVSNLDNDVNTIFRLIYDGLYQYVESRSIPQAVIILGEYQYKSYFVANDEINLVACLTELMVECEWK